MRPVIGIEVDLERSEANGRLFAKCYQTYFEAIWRAGGRPQIIAPILEDAYIEELVPGLNGLVIPGGDDILPAWLGHEAPPCPAVVPVTRERFDFGMALVRAAAAARLPTLGVCYGAQLLNVALGGSIHQDIPEAADHKSGDAAFDLDHDIQIEAGSVLAAVLGERARVNSVHHQAIDAPAPGLRVSARAPDGVVEAVEDPAGFFMGVQWHPERDSCGASGPRLFEALVAAAKA